MAEFLALAHKVIDDGDAVSLDALQSIKARWESMIGPIQAPPIRTGAQTLSAQPRSMIDENPMVRSFRMARRKLSRRGDEVAPPPPPLLLHAAPLGEEPQNPNPNLPCDAPSPPKAGLSTAHPPTPSAPPIFIGNIPLRAHTTVPPPESKFANAFQNSTRRTLRFIPPERQNGEVVVRPTIDMVQAGSRKWENTAVGYFLGKKPPFHQVQSYFRSLWKSVRDVIATSNGFFFIIFDSTKAMDEVIDGGPWLFNGQPLVLQRWEPGMALRKHSHTQVPVWIKLRHLPVEFWTVDGLSTVASGVGRPLYPDAITKACTRLDFARVCVMLDYHSTLPKHVVVMSPREDGLDIPCRVDVEYEWIPSKCTHCCSLGHSTTNCSANRKPSRPPVKVYVPKVDVNPPMPTREEETAPIPMGEEETAPRTMREEEPYEVNPLAKVTNDVSPSTVKGKAIVVYNPFNALNNIDDDNVAVTGGPNTSSPSHVRP